MYKGFAAYASTHVQGDCCRLYFFGECMRGSKFSRAWVKIIREALDLVFSQYPRRMLPRKYIKIIRGKFPRWKRHISDLFTLQAPGVLERPVRILFLRFFFDFFHFLFFLLLQNLVTFRSQIFGKMFFYKYW